MVGRNELMQLDEKDSLALKGAAILAIVFHNYFHLISPVTENEFTFDPDRFQSLLHHLGPTDGIQAVFSFFGHFGVQLFIFLSAYGLAIKYWDDMPPRMEFLRSRILKIYPTFLLAVIGWVFFLDLRAGPFRGWEMARFFAGSTLLTGLGIQNLIPGYDLPPVGPWWFLPFIMQLYFFWPELRKYAIRYGPRGLAILSTGSLMLTYFANPLLERWSVNLLETPIGHLPEICLGIAAARYGFRPTRRLVLCSSIVFLLSSIDAQFWLLSFTSALIIMLGIYSRIRPFLRNRATLVELGELSMSLFFVNGFVRRLIVKVVLRFDVWPLDLAFAVTNLAICLVFAMYVVRLAKWLYTQAPRLGEVFRQWQLTPGVNS
jgi:peptidoglycan/LPS O-acetylase OafA/YrhL